VRIETLERELDNLSHTLTDIKTIMKCIESLKPRIKMLEDRVDNFALELAREREYEERRQYE